MKVPSLCQACVHRIGRGYTCAAFPGGVPVEIQVGADHRRLRGDETRPLVFEQEAGTEAAVVYADWQERFAEPALP